MQVVLRDYQLESVDALCDALDHHHHPLDVLPTGGGKSYVLAALLQQRKQSALVLSHNVLLLKQDSKALARLAPELSQSFFAAGLKQKNAMSDVVFGSVQSVVRSLDTFQRKRPLLLIDEAHLCPRAGEAMYARVFEFFSEAQRVGFTATPMRLDSGSLIDGPDAWFDFIAHEVSVEDLIAAGWLLPLSGVIAEQQADLHAVGSRGGEFVAEQAESAVIDSLPLTTALKQAARIAHKRSSWLLYAAGVRHARLVEAALRAEGISCECILGDTPEDRREQLIAEFAAGLLRCLISVGVLTTGFDAPETDAIICLRPTQSAILWRQLLGRGMRVAQGKKDCLLLDFVGNLERLGGAGCVTRIFDARLNPATMQRVGLLADATRVSAPREDPALRAASTLDPMKDGSAFEAAVTGLDYFLVRSKKYPGKSLVVASYRLEDQMGRALKARKFVCVEYQGGARFHAVQFFRRRGFTEAQVPRVAEVALGLAKSCPDPTEVLVRFDISQRAYSVERERFPALA